METDRGVAISYTISKDVALGDDTSPVALDSQVSLDVGLFETIDPFCVSLGRLSRR